MKRFIISGLLVAAAIIAGVAQSPVDSAKVYFRMGYRHFDPTLGDNKSTMDRFVDRVKQADNSDDIHHLVVRTYASPDGSNAANERLTRNRSAEITRYIVNATGINADLIKAYPEGIAWDELRHLVASEPAVPARDAVLDILDNSPVFVYDADGNIVDSRKNRLMMLNGGAPYRWLYDNLFPRLRNAVAVSLFLKSDVRAARDAAANAARAAADAAEAAARAAAAASQAASNATRGIADAIRAAEEAAARAAEAAEAAARAADEATAAAAQATAAADAAAVEDEVSGAKARAAEAEAARSVAEAARASAEASRSAAEAARAAAEAIAAQVAADEAAKAADTPADVEEAPQPDPLHRFALKTNLLYYAALMPNLELQYRLNDLWTLSLEGNVAWYRRDSKHKYYQIAMISPEVRRWINPRGPWHGMYVGAFAGFAWYDLENGYKGYKGEAGLGGLSFGYMWPITRTLSLEAGIGLGYMYTRYREYIPYDGHYLYQRTKTTQYVGPLKLKFSLAWRFNDINKTKKAIPTL